MKKLLIFDAYGTLFSTGTGSVDAAAEILSLQPTPMDAAAFYSRWKQLHRLHMDEANEKGFIPESEIFTKDLAVLYQCHGIRRDAARDVSIMLRSLTGRKLFPDVPDAIAALRQRFRIVIGSTTDTAPLLANLAAEDFSADAVYTSEMLRLYKPHPDFYRRILEKEGFAPQDALFIGDSPRDDVWGPKSVGITAIWLNRRGNALPDDGPRPDGTISELGQLLTLL